MRRSQDQNLHALMDAAAEEHVAQLQRAEEASVAVTSTPSLPIDLVRFGTHCSASPLQQQRFGTACVPSWEDGRRLQKG